MLTHQVFNVCGNEYPDVTSDVQGIAWGVLEGDGKSHVANTPLHTQQ